MCHLMSSSYIYRKVLPIRPGLDPNWLGIKTSILKKYKKFENKIYDQISITGPDLDPEKIEKLKCVV